MSKRIKLFVQHQQSFTETITEEFEWMAGADALVIDPCHCGVKQFQQMPVKSAVILAGDPERDLNWYEDKSCEWVRDDGLEQVARLRDRWPELNWVPHLTVYRPQISYRFSGQAIGEGFSFYIPDTAAIKGWRVTDGDVLLTEAITMATSLGFSSLWLHSEEAESRAKGLDLEMLHKAHGSALDIWISGGVSDQNHLRNLTKAGGASAVVVSEKLAQETGIDSLLQNLVAEIPVPEAVPVHFEPRPSSAG